MVTDTSSMVLTRTSKLDVRTALATWYRLHHHHRRRDTLTPLNLLRVTLTLNLAPRRLLLSRRARLPSHRLAPRLTQLTLERRRRRRR